MVKMFLSLLQAIGLYFAAIEQVVELLKVLCLPTMNWMCYGSTKSKVVTERLKARRLWCEIKPIVVRLFMLLT